MSSYVLLINSNRGRRCCSWWTDAQLAVNTTSSWLSCFFFVIKEDKWSAADVAAVGFPPLQASMNCARCLLGESECGYLNDGDDERLSFSIFPNLVVWRKNQASFFLNDPFFLYIMPAKTHIHGQSGTALSSGPFGCKMPYVPV
ncbi:conserved hypothetical protein [Trichinella spiralis]|uniref:hypothetical protein n=1 Tax=Trichinella spiralis TaxID=6334 RepID=UPI0001EFBBD4|nr:conserved hypothetical protein [Trichinella spiralis]